MDGQHYQQIRNKWFTLGEQVVKRRKLTQAGYRAMRKHRIELLVFLRRKPMTIHPRKCPNYTDCTHQNIVFGHKLVLVLLRLSLRSYALSASVAAFQLVGFYLMDTEYLCSISVV